MNDFKYEMFGEIVVIFDFSFLDGIPMILLNSFSFDFSDNFLLEFIENIKNIQSFGV